MPNFTISEFQVGAGEEVHPTAEGEEEGEVAVSGHSLLDHSRDNPLNIIG